MPFPDRVLIFNYPISTRQLELKIRQWLSSCQTWFSNRKAVRESLFKEQSVIWALVKTRLGDCMSLGSRVGELQRIAVSGYN